MNYIEAIEKFRNKTLKNLIFVYGEEDFLKKTFIEEIAGDLKDDVFNFTKFNDENFNSQSIIDNSESLPFMSDRRVILIEHLDFSRDKISKFENELNNILNYASNIPNFTTIIFDLKAGFFKGKLYKNFLNLASFVEMNRLNSMELKNFIGKKFISDGLSIKNSEISYIMDRTGYLDRDSELNLNFINNDLEALIEGVKINNKEITKKLIDKFITPFINENIFDLTDNILKKNTAKSLEVFYNLSDEPVEKVFFMIARTFNNLFYIKNLLNNGRSNQAIMNILGIKKFEYDKNFRAISDLGENKIRSSINLLYECEKTWELIVTTQNLKLKNLLLN